MLAALEFQLEQETKLRGSRQLPDLPWETLFNKTVLVNGVRNSGKTGFMQYALFRNQHKLHGVQIVVHCFEDGEEYGRFLPGHDIHIHDTFRHPQSQESQELLVVDEVCGFELDMKAATKIWGFG